LLQLREKLVEKKKERKKKNKFTNHRLSNIFVFTSPKQKLITNRIYYQTILFYFTLFSHKKFRSHFTFKSYKSFFYFYLQQNSLPNVFAQMSKENYICIYIFCADITHTYDGCVQNGCIQYMYKISVCKFHNSKSKASPLSIWDRDNGVSALTNEDAVGQHSLSTLAKEASSPCLEHVWLETMPSSIHGINFREFGVLRS